MSSVRQWLVFFAAAVALFSGAEAQQQEELNVSRIDQSLVGSPITIKDRQLELSGCAAVDGGVLVVEDELVGAVLFLSVERGTFARTEMVKLERKKKDSAPYTALSRLIPVQDFEDIASDGHSTVYLIGSHQGKGGVRRPDREFLIQAEWSARDRELKVVGEQYGLLEAIAPALETIGCSLGLTDVKVSDLLNIEGLALRGDTLYVGLRSPRTPAGKALVLHGPAEEWLHASATPDILELDLEGAGIRALDWDSKYDNLVVLSGTAEEGARDIGSALWRVDPSGGVLTQLLDFEQSVSRKHPEGVCRLAPEQGGKLLVVLDGEGGEEGGSLLQLDG